MDINNAACNSEITGCKVGRLYRSIHASTVLNACDSPFNIPNTHAKRSEEPSKPGCSMDMDKVEEKQSTHKNRMVVLAERGLQRGKAKFFRHKYDVRDRDKLDDTF